MKDHSRDNPPFPEILSAEKSHGGEAMKDMGISDNLQTAIRADPDSSEVLQAEQRIVEDFSKEMEKRYRLIGERTSDMISITTFTDKPIYLYVSPSHKTILGYEPHELLGKCPFDFIHPEDIKKLLPILLHHYNALKNDALCVQERPVTEKLVYRLKDKWEEWHYLETTGDLLEPDHILFLSRDITDKRRLDEELRTIRDKLIERIQERTSDLLRANALLEAEITEREKIEEELRQSEEKYRAIVEAIEDGYYEVDLAGNFTFFNTSLCGILGYTPEEMIGMNNRTYMSPKTAREIFVAYNEVYLTGEPKKIIGYELIRKDRQKRIVQVSVSLIRDSDGCPTGFRGIARDVTYLYQGRTADAGHTTQGIPL
jgi:PAS domain S-box-containing protein